MDASLERQLKETVPPPCFLRQVLRPGNHISLGRTDVIEEFLGLRSIRAVAAARNFRVNNQSLSSSDEHAALVKFLISRAIDLDPHRNELGPPVDVIQLEAFAGIKVRWLKPGCRNTVHR
jgi:hypothetical protein